jgi:putative transposase
MYLTSVVKISTEYHPYIKELQGHGKRLYNSILYHVRQNYLNHSNPNSLSNKNIKYSKSYVQLKDKEFYPIIKSLPEYKLLPSKVAQNIAINVHNNFKSFFGSLKLKQSGSYDKKITIPRYKKDNDLQLLSYDYLNFSIKDNHIILTNSKFSGQYNKNNHSYDIGKINNNKNKPEYKEKIKIKIPENILKYLSENKLHKIVSVNVDKNYNAYIVYGFNDNKNDNLIDFNSLNDNKKQELLLTIKPEECLGIDIGLNNFASCVSIHNAVIYNGKQMKARNQWYNKITSKLQNKIDNIKNELKSNKENKHKNELLNKSLNKSLDKLINKKGKETLKRNNYVKDQIHKMANDIIDNCVKKNIKNIIIGHNKEMKQDINLGNKTNQHFTLLPFLKLINYLAYKGQNHDIQIITTEESYTSKIDHLALEPMVKKVNNDYLGKRKKRGLFQSSLGMIINADINGAIGIVRKVVGDSFIQTITGSRAFLRPVKTNIYN